MPCTRNKIFIGISDSNFLAHALPHRVTTSPASDLQSTRCTERAADFISTNARCHVYDQLLQNTSLLRNSKIALTDKLFPTNDETSLTKISNVLNLTILKSKYNENKNLAV